MSLVSLLKGNTKNQSNSREVVAVNLTQLLEYTEVINYQGNLDREITGLVYDSRLVVPGSIFVAITGYKTDGHEYIPNALALGAEAVVIQNSKFRSGDYTWIEVPDSRMAMADLSSAIYGFPAGKMSIVGVTGTNGKTTTTNLITSILEESGYKTGLIGTIHNRIGNETIPVHHTTPEAPDLQKLFVSFLEKGARYAVMEVSSHALDLYRVRGTEFDVAVFTNLTQDHLDFHGNMEKYLAAKGKLFASLNKKGTKQRRKFAVINADDPYAEALAEMTTAAVITYGIKKQADVRALNVKVEAKGVSFTLKYTDKEIPVLLKLTGIFNVYNCLAAISVGLVEGISIEKIINTLEKVEGIPGRFEKVDEGQDFTVIVDYSHTPDSLENCLKTAREFAAGRIITVFGCGGDRDRTKRPIMGEVSARLSDFTILTSDNPRSEEPKSIINDIIPGVSKIVGKDKYLELVDRKEAIYKAVNLARPGDVVIIAGKGHEDYQVIASRILNFSDRSVAIDAIKALER